MHNWHNYKLKFCENKFVTWEKPLIAYKRKVRNIKISQFRGYVEDLIKTIYYNKHDPTYRRRVLSTSGPCTFVLD